MKRSIHVAYRYRRALALAVAACGFGVLYTAARALGFEVQVAGVSDAAVRPVAHFCVYGMLAVLVAKALWDQHLLAWLIAIVLATGEEIHQLFVPLRYAGIGDWLVNLAGITAFLVGAKLLAHRSASHTATRRVLEPQQSHR